MSSLRRRLSNRGTSVLAALVMVAILVVVGYAFSEIRTAYMNNTQQLAAAGGVLALGNGTGNYSQVMQAQAQAKIPDCPSPQTPPAKTPVAPLTESQCNDQGQPDVCKQTVTQSGTSKTVYYRFNYLVRAELVSGKLTPVVTRSVDRSGTVDSSALAKVTYCAALSNSSEKCSDASGKASSSVCASVSTSWAHAASDVAAGFVDKSIKPSDLAGKMNPQTSNSVLGAFQDAKQTYNCGYMGAACATIAPAVADPKSDVMQQFAALQTCGSSTSGSPSCPSDSTQSGTQGNGDYSTPPNLNKDLYQGPCPNGGTMDPQTGNCSVPDYSENGCPSGQVPDPNNGYTCGAAKTGGSKTCPTGTVGTPPNCTRSGNGGYTGCQGSSCSPGGVGGITGGGLNLGSLSSLLSGLARGAMQSGAGSSQSACTSDQNAYNQQLQQYQYQMQQYQYQMQLYQQQQQLAQYNGSAVAPLPPTQPSQPCYNPNAGGQCTAQPPAQPSASQCTVGAWKPLYSGACIVNWQCVPTSGNGQQPTAQLSCNPQVADVGMSVAVAYSCQNATGSQGSGFSTNNAVSGTSTVTVAAPPAGANTATYGLTCVNGQLTASSQCSVQISQPSIVLVANPQQVSKNDTTTIGWVTSGMQSCHIASPQQIDFSQHNANNTSVNGVASSSPIVAQTDFILTCQTLGGGTKTATTTVSFPGAPVLDPNASSITVSTNADGATVNHGDSVSVTWQTATPPTGAAISLWLIDEHSGNTAGLVSGGQSTSGSYTWKIPATTDTCDNNSPAPCAADLVPGRSYDIEAALYTPADAFLGGLPVPQNAVDPTYSDYNYSGSFTIGQ